MSSTPTASGHALRDRIRSNNLNEPNSADSALAKRERRERMFGEFSSQSSPGRNDEHSGYSRTLSRRRQFDRSDNHQRSYTSMSQHPSLRSSRTLGNIRGQSDDLSVTGSGSGGSGSAGSSSLGRLKAAVGLGVSMANNSDVTIPSSLSRPSTSSVRPRPALPKSFFDPNIRNSPETLSPRTSENDNRHNPMSVSAQSSPVPSSSSRGLNGRDSFVSGREGGNDDDDAELTLTHSSTSSRPSQSAATTGRWVRPKRAEVSREDGVGSSSKRMAEHRQSVDEARGSATTTSRYHCELAGNSFYIATMLTGRVLTDDEEEPRPRDSWSSYTRKSSELPEQQQRPSVDHRRRGTDASSSYDELQDLRQRIRALELNRPSSRAGGSSGAGSGSGGDARSVRASALDRDRTLRGLAAVANGHAADVDGQERPPSRNYGSVGGREQLRASVRRSRTIAVDDSNNTPSPRTGRESSISRSDSTIRHLISPTGQGMSSPTTASTPSRPASTNMTEHQRLLVDTLDRFDRQLSSTGGDSSSELVQRMSMLVEATAKLNIGLRSLVTSTVEAQIAAELDDAAKPPPPSSDLAHVEKAASSLLRASDDQCRSLTEGLMAFIRFEKQRERGAPGTGTGTATPNLGSPHPNVAGGSRSRTTNSPRLPPSFTQNNNSNNSPSVEEGGGGVTRGSVSRSLAATTTRDSPTLRNLSSRAGAALQFQHEPTPSPTTRSSRAQRAPPLMDSSDHSKGAAVAPLVGPAPRRSKSSVRFQDTNAMRITATDLRE
jgi:hypothetical protein